MQFHSTKSHRFHLLDALRGIAALLILPRHAPPQLTHAFPVYNSFLAVDFFFCLSGFVIAFSYEDRLRTRMSLRDFTAARLIRLCPLVALGTAIVLANLTVTGHIRTLASPAHVVLISLLSILLLPNFFMPEFGAVLFPLIEPAWSLFFEMLANVGYACLVKLRAARTAVLVSLGLVSIAAVAWSLKTHLNLDSGATRSTAWIGLARVGFAFCAGVCLFRLHRRADRLHIAGPRALVVAAAIIAVMVAAFTVSTAVTRSGGFNLLAAAVLFPAVVHVSSKVELAARWTAGCAFLGDLSYPLYVIHTPLLAPLYTPKAIRLGAAHPMLVPFAMSTFFLLLAYVAFWLAKHFDEPVRRLLTARYNVLTGRMPRPVEVV